ncbi:MAG TPA: dTDP-4-dehydrorhamnose 3,5-epimerase family protein, partial [Streptosporangiaceae bacterium]
MDLRAVSPAFGTWHAERFGQGRRAALVLPPGVGHTFLSLADGSAVAYLISHSHNPGLERRINPLDPDNVVTGGQTVALSGSGTDLGFLGASQNGTASGTVTVHYTDGSSQS